MAYSRLFEDELEPWKPEDYSGFLDSAYMDETLPDDFFDDDISRVMKEDPYYCRLKERIFERVDEEKSGGDIERETDEGEVKYRSTRHGTIVYNDKEEPVLVLGSKNVLTPKINIVPDYTPAEAVFKYYMEYMDNPSVDFPSIGVARPSIPIGAIEQVPFYDSLDEQMARRGGLIYDPSYFFIQKNPESIMVYPTSPDIEEEDVKRKMQGKDFLFSSRRPVPAKYWEGRRVAYLQFNPYHPMAPAYIRERDSISIDGGVVTGTYTWGSKIISYRFDPLDVNYRIHSDVWGALVGYTSYYLAMFDLVANFDILAILPELLAYEYKFYPFAPLAMVHGFSSKYEGRVTDSDKVTHDQREQLYSSMTYQAREYDPNRVCFYYTNQVISIKSEGESFFDVTTQYKLIIHTGVRAEVLVCDRATSGVHMRIMKGDLTSRFTEKKDIFVLFSVKKKEFKVYSREGDGDSVQMLYVEGAHFSKCPRNSTGSLLRVPHTYSFLEYIEAYLKRTDDKKFVNSMRHPQVQLPEEAIEYLELEELQVSIREAIDSVPAYKTTADNVDYEFLESDFLRNLMAHPSIEEDDSQIDLKIDKTAKILDHNVNLDNGSDPNQASNRRKKKKK